MNVRPGLIVVVGLLLFGTTTCSKKFRAYRCTACLVDNPKQCYTYSDSDSGLSGSLDSACSEAQSHFCRHGKFGIGATHEEQDAWDRCMDQKFKYNGSSFYVRSTPSWFGATR